MPPQPPAPFQLELEDITPPDAFLPEPATAWWIWASIAAGVIILTITLYYSYRKWRKSGKQATLDHLAAAFDQAREKITLTRQQLEELSTSQIATNLSLALRHYLTETSADPALFQTHEEFLLSKEALASLPTGGREKTRAFYELLAAAKYGQADSPLSQPEALCDEALSLLTSLDSSHPSRQL